MKERISPRQTLWQLQPIDFDGRYLRPGSLFTSRDACEQFIKAHPSSQYEKAIARQVFVLEYNEGAD